MLAGQQPVRQGGRGKTKTYKIRYYNAYSILNKINELKAECLLTKPDIIQVCETFCREEIDNAALQIPGYQLVNRRDGRDTAGGRGRGLLVYARDGIAAAELKLEGEDEVTECCAITIPWGGGGTEVVKLILVYRPPETPGSQADKGNTERLCRLLRKQQGKVVICGDFNLPKVDWDRGWSNCAGERMVVDTLHDMFWHQLVKEPTHRLGNLLDLCVTSSLELIAGVEVVEPLGASDHKGLEVNLLGATADRTTKELVPDWAKANMVKMREMLGETEWGVELDQLGGVESMDKFYSLVDKVTLECVPRKLRRTSNKPLWMTSNIMRMLRKKRRLWRAYTEEAYYRQDFRDFIAYREVQKEIRKEIGKAKRKVEKNLAKNAKKNPKKFYSYLKSKTSNRVGVGPLLGEEGLVTDDKEMAGILNAQYTSVFTSEDTTSMPEPELLYTGGNPLNVVRFEREEVEKKLRKVKSSGAPGPDGLWSKVLHDMAEVLAVPLTIIFNRLMEEGGVPQIWRMANVCPIFKKGTKGDPANYRPVSLTCVVGKVMESLIRDKIVEHLERNRLIRASQHGFMAGRSTTTNLIVYMDALTKLMEEGKAVDVLYLDFAKAFDKVPHLRLLQKCQGLGVGGKVLEWIRAWLGDRQQRVVLNGEKSEWAEVLSGVPQGSVLGPTLFLIFINDIDRAVDLTSSMLLKFADDTKMARVVESSEQQREFQSNIDRLEQWSDDWQMLFNSGKCHILHLGFNNSKHEYRMGGGGSADSGVREGCWGYSPPEPKAQHAVCQGGG